MSATVEEAEIVAAGLRRLADDQQVLWEVARAAIEDQLIEWRDDRLSMPLRNNGFVVKEKDGTASSIIRFGPEDGVRIALLALADHLAGPKPTCPRCLGEGTVRVRAGGVMPGREYECPECGGES